MTAGSRLYFMGHEKSIYTSEGRNNTLPDVLDSNINDGKIKVCKAHVV